MEPLCFECESDLRARTVHKHNRSPSDPKRGLPRCGVGSDWGAPRGACAALPVLHGGRRHGIERTSHPAPWVQALEIHAGGREGLVAEQLLYGPNVVAVPEQVREDGVPNLVRRRSLGDSGDQRRGREGVLNGRVMEMDAHPVPRAPIAKGARLRKDSGPSPLPEHTGAFARRRVGYRSMDGGNLDGTLDAHRGLDGSSGTLNTSPKRNRDTARAWLGAHALTRRTTASSTRKRCTSGAPHALGCRRAQNRI